MRILPFEQSFMKLYMPMILAFMVFLILITFVGTFWVKNISNHWLYTISNNHFIQVVHLEHLEQSQIDKKINNIKKLIKYEENVNLVKVYSDEEKEKILSPWIGNAIENLGVQYPDVIEIKIVDGNDSTLKKIEEKIYDIDDNIIINSEAQWKKEIETIVKSILKILFTIMFLLSVVCGVIIIVSINSLIKINHKNIRMLFLMGANDSYVSKIFNREILKVVLISTTIGFVVCILVGTYILSSINNGISHSFLFDAMLSSPIMVMLIIIVCYISSFIALRSQFSKI